MYSYLIGTVVEMNIDHIVVENSGIGYLIYVNNHMNIHEVKK